MDRIRRTESKDALRQFATAAELIRDAELKVASAIRRINNRDAQKECFDSLRFLSSARCRIMESGVTDRDLDRASARIMIEQARIWRNILEEISADDEESLLKTSLSPEFIDCIYELGRQAEFLIHRAEKTKE